MGAARYKLYPAYKPSGVEWLGDIPEGWEAIQVGRLFRRLKRTDHTDKQLLSVYRDHGVVPKASRDDNNNKASEDLSPYQLVEKNDLVMNKMKTWQGSIAISEHEGIVSPAYFVYQPEPKLFEVAEPKYVHFLLRNPMYIAQYLRRSKGIRVSQWDLDPGEFQKIELLLPSLPEQTKIAAFLVYETGKIDALIAKQEQLIALLEEKRQAVISHAVTKGLDPTAPLRPSGIDWLGDVPEHWEVKPLKNLITETSSISYGIVQPGDALDTGVPFVQTTNMTTGDFDLLKLQKTLPSIAAQFPRSKLHGGEVLLGIRASIGAAHIVPDFLKGANLSRGVARIECAELVSPDFLVQFFRSKSAEQYWNLGKQGSTFNEVSIATVRELKISLPPQAEQADIVDFLAAKNAVFDALDAQAQSANALLKERRTALISAAVTGKIDVRDWQPPQPLSDTDFSTENLQEAAI